MASQTVSTASEPVPKKSDHRNLFEQNEKYGQHVVISTDSDGSSSSGENQQGASIPIRMKIIAVLLVTAVGFGSHWSSGVTGAMKSTLKKVCESLSDDLKVLKAKNK